MLVTGATSGIGRDAAAALAAKGADVIVHGRTRARVRRAVAHLRRHAAHAEVHELVADLGERASVEAMADEVLERFLYLDVLIHNAAIVAHKRTLSPDGIELQLAVNHLAPFLLTHRLLPLLRRSAPARIVVVASQLERDGRFDFDDLHCDHGYDANAAYSRSKLANVLFTGELARRIEGSGVTVNCLHPGIAGTKVLNALVGRPRWAAPWTRHEQPKADLAIGGIVRLAMEPALASVNGAYFREEERVDPSAQARDTGLAQRLWTASERLVGLA